MAGDPWTDTADKPVSQLSVFGVSASKLARNFRICSPPALLTARVGDREQETSGINTF